MNVSAIIAEYNPFHNGHKYQIDYLKRSLHTDYVIVMMSGNYVQRGAPAALDKYRRAEAALRCGADLVLELPLFYATGSAETFADGAVELLNRLGFISSLCFGAETPELTTLSKIASLLAREPEEYLNHLKQGLKIGLSYPGSRQQALLRFFETPMHPAIIKLLSSPNNILAIEYLKALQKRSSAIEPLPIMRMNSQYHEKRLPKGHSFASATAIRETLYRHQTKQALEQIEPYVPGPAFQIYQAAFADYQPVAPDDFSEYLYHRLLFLTKDELTAIPDVSGDLAERILKQRSGFVSFTQFAALLKTRQMTLTRIQRVLLHILLNQERRDRPQTPYVRVLGLKKSAAGLLKQIPNRLSGAEDGSLADSQRKENSPGLWLITKTADAAEALEKEILQNQLYNRAVYARSEFVIPDDYRHKLIILP